MPVPIWAGRYIGLPFAEHGRDRSGVDCWGLVRLVLAEQFSIPLPSFTGEYLNTVEPGRIGALIEREIPNWDEMKPGREDPGDVVILRVKGRPMHVGLVLGDAQMLHIERGINSAIERYASAHWKDRIHGFYRYRNFIDHESTEGYES